MVLNKQFDESIRQFEIEIARLKEQDAKDNAYKIQQLELQKAQLKEEQRQFNASLAEEKRQFNAKQSSGGSISGGSSGGSVQVKGDSNVTKDSQGGAPVVDMASVISLGYGPISATRLNQLVASGEVVEYEENGKLKYKKAKK